MAKALPMTSEGILRLPAPPVKGKKVALRGCLRLQVTLSLVICGNKGDLFCVYIALGL